MCGGTGDAQFPVSYTIARWWIGLGALSGAGSIQSVDEVVVNADFAPYTTPWPSMASATLIKPAMFAPFT